MTTLFIDRRNLQLSADSEALIFYDRNTDQKIGTVPIRLLERLCIYGDIQLSAAVLGKLGAHGVGILVLNGRKKAPVLLMPNLKVDAKRRAAQFTAAQAPEFCLAQAKQWLSSKISAQQAFIKQHSQQHTHLSSKHQTLERILQQITASPDKETLLGYEGVASAHYFSAWQAVLPTSLRFNGRNRRPPKDPFNVVLSLGYTLLHFELVRRIYLIGLDPFVGFLHSISHGRESLASDLLEPLRPDYDQWAGQLFAQKTLRPEDFSLRQQACLMGKAGRIRFYSAFEHHLQERQTVLRESVRQLLQAIGRYTGQDPADFDYTEAHLEQTE